MIQPWKALATCLRVFYQGPWLEGKEKGVFFFPSRPVIMFIANLALSFRQLGPVPIWRDLQGYERCFRGETLSRSCLVWNSIPHCPLKKNNKKKKTQFQWIAKHLYLEFVWLKDLLSGENENGSIFPPYLKKQAPWCIFEGLRPCWLSYREAPYHSFSSGGQNRAGQSGLGF